MKRLKYRHPLKGKSLPIVISILIVSLFTAYIAPLATMYDVDALYVLIIDAVAILVTVIIDYIIVNHLTKEEREKIKNARPPEWKKITKKIKSHFKEDVKALLFYMGCVMILVLIVSVISLIAEGFESMWVSLIILVPVTVIVFTAIGIYEHIWANMDDSAKYTRIKIDHCFYGERYRGGRRKYIVFYLPDGKYVLETDYAIPIDEIIVIKYKCFIRFEDARYFI